MGLLLWYIRRAPGKVASGVVYNKVYPQGEDGFSEVYPVEGDHRGSEKKQSGWKGGSQIQIMEERGHTASFGIVRIDDTYFRCSEEKENGLASKTGPCLPY